MQRIIQSRVISKFSSYQYHPFKSFVQNRCYCNKVKLEATGSVNYDNEPDKSDLKLNKGRFENDKAWVDKLLYSSYLNQFLPPPSFRHKLKKRFEINELSTKEFVAQATIAPPVAIRYLLEDEDENQQDQKHREVAGEDEENNENSQAEFPFKIESKTEFTEDRIPFEPCDESEHEENDKTEPIKLVSVADKLREEAVDLDQVLGGTTSNDEGELLEAAVQACLLKAGTPNPKVPPSSVPCGGCGAMLHCQDQSLPGYISSEKFKGAKKKDLMGEVCYRCSVLESQQATLDVNVSPEDYPRIVSKIKETFSMVILLADVTDFPCSIWPGILDIIGTKRPILLVGNKVDMIPQDSPDYLRRLEESLIKSTVDLGMLDANVIHTALISAKTGYGVENLISMIFRLWGGRGDIFIMGCTNVGKSSLFNLFVQSDLCQPRVSDKVQTATISQWPGTTLNMLKFPMTEPHGFRKHLRFKRLVAEQGVLRAEERERIKEFEITKNPELITLSGHVGKTFVSKEVMDKYESVEKETLVDLFQINPNSTGPPLVIKKGQWNPEDPKFAKGHWVYDTPGAVNTNQILDLLTLPELMHSLPKTLIQPRTFFIKPETTFFLGGLVRIDFVEGSDPVRFTVFANSSLPATMSLTSDADEVYKQAFGTKVFGVPCGNNARLAQFPELKSKSINLQGVAHNYSCADIVLSSIGWIAVTAGRQRRFKLSVYTPDGKGIFIREPALLPYAVNWKGKRIRGTYSYMPHKLYEPHKAKSYKIKRPAPPPYLQFKNKERQH